MCLCLAAASFADRASSCANHKLSVSSKIFVEKHLERNSSGSVERKPWYRVDYYL